MKHLKLISIVLTPLGLLCSCAAAPEEVAAPTTVNSDHAIYAAAALPADEAAPTTKPAADEATPSTQPSALPAGHPAVGQANQPALPKGHPQIPAKNSGQLPKGHPDIAAMRAAAAAGTTQPAVKPGLYIRVTQRTKGGPAIGAEPITLEFYAVGEVVKKIEAQLNTEGSALIQDLPSQEVVPVVKINHAGVEYTVEGDPLDAVHPQQRINVAVYETTEQTPEWRVQMRHLMVQPVAGGVEVMDMMVVENPADRAWVGAAGDDGKRRTFEVAVPKGAKDLKLGGGYHDCCVTVEDGRIINTMAVIPGVTQYQMQYTLPVDKDGKAVVLTVAPAPVQHMMAFVSDDGSTVVPAGIESAGSRKTEKGGAVRMYQGKDMPAGKEASLTVSNIQAASATGASTETVAGAAAEPITMKLPQVIAAAGTLLLVLFAVAFMLVRPGKSAKRAVKA
jgi:hypothetical protein